MSAYKFITIDDELCIWFDGSHKNLEELKNIVNNYEQHLQEANRALGELIENIKLIENTTKNEPKCQ